MIDNEIQLIATSIIMANSMYGYIENVHLGRADEEFAKHYISETIKHLTEAYDNMERLDKYLRGLNDKEKRSV